MKLSKLQMERICDKLGCNLISYSYLASGNHNDIYLIKSEKGNYVMKVGEDSKRLVDEFNTIKNLKKGLGQKVYFFDSSHKVLPKTFFIQEQLIGKHPTKKVNDNFVISIAKWYRTLHGITSTNIDPKEKKIFHSLSYWANYQINKSEQDRENVSDNIIHEINNFFKEIKELSEKHEALFKTRKKFSLNQNDPSEENIFITKNGIRVIDWEFSGYGLYERDLILFLERYKLSKKQEDLFFNYYGKNKSDLTKKMNILSLILSCGDISYLLNRLSLLKQGKISKLKQSSKKQQLIRRLKDIIGQAKKKLKEIR